MSRTKKLLPLFVSESLRGIAVSWLAIFSAIFIYQRMLMVASGRRALALVFFSFALFGLGKLIGDCWAEESSLRRGLRFSLNLGLVLMDIGFLFFWLSVKNTWFLIPAELIWGLSAGFYWFGWYGMVGKLGKEGRYGSAFGFSSLLRGAANLLAPIVGGLLIDIWGYSALFLAGIGLVITALFFSLFLEKEITHRDTSLGEVLRLFTTHKDAFLAYFSLGGLGLIASTSFVLYLLLILKRELDLGRFYSLAVILVAGAEFLIGKLADWEKRPMVVWGSLVRSFVWLGRLMTKNIILLLGLKVVNDVAVGMVGIPLGVLSLEKALDGHSTGRAVLFREAAISLGYLGGGVILGTMALVGVPLEVGFVLAALFALAPVLIQVKGRGRN